MHNQTNRENRMKRHFSVMFVAIYDYFIIASIAVHTANPKHQKLY